VTRRAQLRIVAALAVVLVGTLSVQSAVAAPPTNGPNAAASPIKSLTMTRAGTSNVDLRKLPQIAAPAGHERGARDNMEEPESPPVVRHGTPSNTDIGSGVATPSGPAPTSSSFEGMHYNESCTGGFCGDGHPPDTNGDVGRLHYAQVINVALAIYDKATGNREVGITFNSLMSQGSFGNLCDTDNFGDPVVLYDTFAGRWIVTDFAFQLTELGSLTYPPGAYQCFAVSKGENPVTSGWNFYSLEVGSSLHDYEKLGVWPDALYMTANMYAGGLLFSNVRAWAFDRADMYAGAATVDIQQVDFLPTDSMGRDTFTVLPANARLQAGTPPAGSPNYMASIWGDYESAQVWKYHIDWTTPANSSLTGPFDAAIAAYDDPPGAIAVKDGNELDSLGSRLMVQNQYSNVAGVESLWDLHTVLGGDAEQAAIQWVQINVTGGTVGATATQSSTYNPDDDSRWMGSLAVDRAGNMAMGYSVASPTLYPAIRYAGRLTTDPINTLGQEETSMIEGNGAQTHIFSDGTDDERWGDYSAMTLDVDGCTFWYTTEYYPTQIANNGTPSSGNGDFHTRIGHFRYPTTACVPTAPPCVVGPYPDVPAGHPFCAVIQWMKDLGITTGYGDGTYRPTADVTRQSMAAFLARLADATLTPCAVPPFTDVPTTHPFCEEIKWMKTAGISTGFGDETYRPSLSVTRQAMAPFLARTAAATVSTCSTQPFPDVATSNPFCPEIQWMKTAGISTGFEDGTYRPGTNVTRQAMATFLFLTYQVMTDPPTGP
jgi:hypothetical protein